MPVPGKLGHFRIEREIGRGGMGVVYEATDLRLERAVAIKVLSSRCVEDPEHVARLEREAKTLAAVQHPNIAGIHGFEAAGETRYLVLELVDGESLAHRIQRGPLPFREALDVARQIAAALETAHETGIIHRDLKPGNVALRPEGQVKVLDFGLAKAIGPRRSSNETAPNVVLGTTPYMSPEQTLGKTLDPRSDIWSFGCVLYEMLTARPAFAGASTSDCVTAILNQDPDWNRLPVETPAAVRVLLRRCLAKELDRRIHHAADIRIEIEDIVAGRQEPVPHTRPRGPWTGSLVATVMLGIGIAVGLLLKRAPEASNRPVRFSFVPPQERVADTLVFLGGSAIAVSPDGRKLCYVAAEKGESRLYLRDLNEFETTPVMGSEEATTPFFSPDSRYLAFAARGSLMKLALDGGTPETICRAPNLRGAAWGPNDKILFAPSLGTPLYTVSAQGGAARPLTKLDPSRKEFSHRYPCFYPGGALMTVYAQGESRHERQGIARIDLETGDHQPLFGGGSLGFYASSGHLVYGPGDGSLRARAFDGHSAGAKETTVLDRVLTLRLTGVSNFCLTENGVLAYIPGGKVWGHHLVTWRDRADQRSLAIPSDVSYGAIAVSPDGTRLAATVIGDLGGTDIWIYDIGEGASKKLRLTFDGQSLIPIWSPKGVSIVYSSLADGHMRLYEQRVDRVTEPPQPLTSGSSQRFANAWQGDTLAFTEIDPHTGFDVAILDVARGTSRALVASDYNELNATFSPDGEWIAYQSDESGRYEVYAHRIVDGKKIPVSVKGGREPLWLRRTEGEELVYRRGETLMRVSVQREPELLFGEPVPLLEGLATGPPARCYDATPDGERFIVPEVVPSQFEIRVTLNWLSELEELLSSKP